MDARFSYTVKIGYRFPVFRRDVTDQTLSGRGGSCLSCQKALHRKASRVLVEQWPLHCNENPIHVSVSDLLFIYCISRIGSNIFCSRTDRSIVGIYKALSDTWMWKLGLRPHNFFSGNIYFEFSVLCICSVSWNG